jgi:hypothetical protein
MTKEQKALRIYDLLREAHKSVKRIWKEFPEIASDGHGHDAQWEMAVDAADNTLYLAEAFFVNQVKP